MKIKKNLVEMIMTFFVVTACVTIMQGILGVIFQPDQKIGWDAFFSPPLFGVLTTLLGCVTYSSKELTVAQAFGRKVIHLILIELLVFGLNAWAGKTYKGTFCTSIIIAIAIVYITVNLVLYINDQKSAEQFNKKLKQFQESVAGAKKENV